MRIEVRCECSAECKEWAMVELQGSLELQNPQQQLQNLPIGSLCRATEDKYSFTVGYHELEGRKVALKKPLLVLRKVKTDGMDVDPPLQGQLSSKNLDVVGIIRHKILFKTRPKALISKPEVKSKKMRTESIAAS